MEKVEKPTNIDEKNDDGVKECIVFEIILYRRICS
jgi:hypothetical protein